MSFTTHTGNRGLVLEEKLIFEQGEPGRTGVDLPKPAGIKSRLGGLDRDSDVGLPGLSEPQVVRHFTRLSQKNFGIDSGFFPLGSCTMKHNPRLNEKVARMPGLADLHPMQPESTVQGALELIDSCAHWCRNQRTEPTRQRPRHVVSRLIRSRPPKMAVWTLPRSKPSLATMWRVSC